MQKIGAIKTWTCLNHIIAALKKHFDSLTTPKDIDYGKKRLLNDGKNVTMLPETLTDWVSNLWTPFRPPINIAIERKKRNG